MASDTGTDSGLAGLRVQLLALAERPRSPVLKPRGVQDLKAQSSFTFLALHDEQLPHNEEPQLRHFIAKLYQECGVARESTTGAAGSDKRLDASDPPALLHKRSAVSDHKHEDPPVLVPRECSESLPMLEIQRCMLCGCDKFTPARSETPCVLCGAHSNRLARVPSVPSHEDRPKSSLPPRLAQIAAACRQRRFGPSAANGAFEHHHPQAPPSPCRAPNSP